MASRQLQTAEAAHAARTADAVKAAELAQQFTGSNAAIAQDLTVTDRAVEKHVANIFTKLALPVSAADSRRVLAVLRYLGV
jgi:FixJ family two-component response regulator